MHALKRLADTRVTFRFFFFRSGTALGPLRGETLLNAKQYEGASAFACQPALSGQHLLVGDFAPSLIFLNYENRHVTARSAQLSVR